MAIEIEAKMRVGDVAALQGRLTDAGARHEGFIDEVNVFYDRPDRSLLRCGEGLRLRIETRADQGATAVILTHKGRQAAGQFKKRSEAQLAVASAADAEALLTALGFVSILRFAKKRSRWRLDDCAVELDTLPRLGQFVEIEGPSERSVAAVCRKLALQDQELITKSYAALVDEYLTRQGPGRSELRFEEC